MKKTQKQQIRTWMDKRMENLTRHQKFLGYRLADAGYTYNAACRLITALHDSNHTSHERADTLRREFDNGTYTLHGRVGLRGLTHVRREVLEETLPHGVLTSEAIRVVAKEVLIEKLSKGEDLSPLEKLQLVADLSFDTRPTYE